MCSMDGEPFVFHDDHLKRTTQGKGDFGLAHSDRIRGLDAGSWFSKRFKGEKIPHFKEVLHWLMRTGVQANVEIKPYPKTMQQTVTSVLSHIHRHWPAENELPLVSSFDWEALTLCRNLAPEMPLGLLMHDWKEAYLEKARELGCYSVHLNRRILSPERVKVAKEAGYVVCAYTVNRKRLAQKLFSWGVDAIFSDYPDLL
jgi:glycerophosphoryl diester phosphodiesterase